MRSILKSVLGLGLLASMWAASVGAVYAQGDGRFDRRQTTAQNCEFRNCWPNGAAARTYRGNPEFARRRSDDVPVVRRRGGPPYRQYEYRPNPPPYYRPYRPYRPYYYDRDYYGSGIYLNVTPRYYEPPRYYPRRAVRLSAAHVRWCYNRYRSYRHYDNTYQPYGGPRRQCYSPYS